jgi:uncharacterized alpha/beta hydrolase family protein
MSKSIDSLLNQVRRGSEDLDEGTSQDDIIRYLTSFYISHLDEKQEEINQEQRKTDQLAEQKARESSEQKDYAAYLGISLQGENNPYIGSSK